MVKQSTFRLARFPPLLFLLLLLLLIALFWLPTSIATPADPPKFFLLSAPHKSTSAIPLYAPTHHHLDHALFQRNLQSAAISRRCKRSRPWPRSSTSHDELRSIGFLSGAYTLPLNISSSTSRNSPQRVFVQLDTGSSDLWITSTSCTTPECRDANVPKFNPETSASFSTIQVDADAGAAFRLNLTASSFGGNSNTDRSSFGSHLKLQPRQIKQKRQEIPFSIYYDDATSASGILASDSISLGHLQVSQQAFALVNATNVTLGLQGISGVLGLGFARGSVVSRSLIAYESEIGQVRTLPVMTSLLGDGQASYPMFGMYLTRDGGRATFGAVDPQILPTQRDRALVEWYDVYPFPSGDTSLPANDTLNVDADALGPYVQWVLPLHSAGVAGTPVTLTPTYSSANPHPLALIDSGSSSIIGPASDVEAIFSRILNSRHVGGGRFVVPCDTTSRMYFSFGGRNLTLLPSDYIIGPDAQQPFLCFAWPSASPPDTTGISWILGTPFLRTVYSLFSLGIDTKESPKIGFYPLRQPPTATASSLVFPPQPTDSLSSFLSNQATTIDSWIPNRLVTLTRGESRPYFFENATVMPSVGKIQTVGGAWMSYSPILPTGTGAQLPVIASSSIPPPVPAATSASGNSGGGGSIGQNSNGATQPIVGRGITNTKCSIFAVTLAVIVALMAV